MRNNKQSEDKTNMGVGVATGLTIGFLGGMLIHILLIPIAVALGVAYDDWKNKQDK